jgi:putative oxidoreductase
MDFLQNLVILISRICLCSIYLWAGWTKIVDWKGTVAYMQSKHFPLISLMLPGAIILQIVGGLSLLLGFYCRSGALIF